MISDMTLDSLERCRTGAFFHSKKNRVFSSVVEGKPCVVKVYRGEWRDRASVEYGLLQDCRNRGVPVPEPLALLDGAVVMALVEGLVASDEFDRIINFGSSLSLTPEQERLADTLARWLARFHSAFDFKMVRGDTILRNFILAEAEVVGLDFEETSRGDTLTDLGEICSSVMMTDPAFTARKVAFANHLADRYWTCSGQRRADELSGAVAAAVRHYAQYRANGQELLAHATKVEGGLIKI